MGFYNTSKKISQSLFFFILGEGGPRGHKHKNSVMRHLLIYIWDIMILYLIKERIKYDQKQLSKKSV